MTALEHAIGDDSTINEGDEEKIQMIVTPVLERSIQIA